jgi:hypothetical protein
MNKTQEQRLGFGRRAGTLHIFALIAALFTCACVQDDAGSFGDEAAEPQPQLCCPLAGGEVDGCSCVEAEGECQRDAEPERCPDGEGPVETTCADGSAECAGCPSLTGACEGRPVSVEEVPVDTCESRYCCDGCSPYQGTQTTCKGCVSAGAAGCGPDQVAVSCPDNTCYSGGAECRYGDSKFGPWDECCLGGS